MNETLPLYPSVSPFVASNIALDRDRFMRSMLRILTDVLVDVVGTKGTLGYVSLVGQSMASHMRALYLADLAQETLSREQLSGLLIDLKRRIDGDFYVIEETPERIVFGNRRCPFGDRVVGQPALCMMTSNVFGSIASATTGYARVDLNETIAEGHDGCRIVLWLTPPPIGAPAVRGSEFFGD